MLRQILQTIYGSEPLLEMGFYSAEADIATSISDMDMLNAISV